MPRRAPSVLPVAPPSRLLGLVCAAAIVASTTALVFPLRTVAPVVSLGVVYLVAVLVISTVWGAWLGVVARERGTTYVVMGVPGGRRGLRRFSEPLHDRLLELLPGVDLRIVADRAEPRSP